MKSLVGMLLLLVACPLYVKAELPPLRIALVQAGLVWGDVDANLTAFDKRVKDAENGAYPPTLNGLIHPVLPLNWP